MADVENHPEEMAQVTNVTESINAKLAAQGDFHLRDACHEEDAGRVCESSSKTERLPFECPVLPAVGNAANEKQAVLPICGPPPRPYCHNIKKTVCSPVMGKLTVSGPFTVIAGPTATIDPPNWEALPLKMLGLRLTFTNCTPKDQLTTFRHTENVQQGAQVTKSKTLQTSIKIDQSIGFDFFGDAKTTISFSRSTSITDSSTENYRTEHALEVTQPVTAAANGLTTATHYWIQRDVPIKFKGTVKLDAPLASNMAGVNRISQVLKPEDLVFDFAGIVRDSTFEDTTVAMHYRSMTKAECNASPGLRVSSEPYAKACDKGACRNIAAEVR
ncbi:hypothetical protein HHL11_06890 [Ramlibacter sp. G-1-2-2]|uniref:Uncharacterized protein n=1 Tax=Ramlibacter agri TaxID=2728837 RepID=A0A848H4B2_9BURK|nr:hypothetical protein [Ramlibacter agri]NML43473.1 hypothetical protein [Ramlibacter agri]